MSLLAALLLAVTAAARADEPRRPIQDNSFLVEEAYNQEPGVIQHVARFTASAAGTGRSPSPRSGRSAVRHTRSA
jgi:hypothetical protein